MSGTISIVPMAIYAITLLVKTTLEQADYNKIKAENDAQQIKRNIDLKNSIRESMLNNTTDYVKVDDPELLCREYETVFTDETILIKTLEEYGFSECKNDNGKILCRSGNFVVEFFKTDERPYSMKISCMDECNNHEFVSDIHEEYAQNVQEESYIKLKERLKKYNLQIDDEEVLDDNSIMVTVNLE